MISKRLVPTGVAAREIGLSSSTLSRYVKAGLIEPDLVSAGGHFRWDVERLRRQLADLQKRRNDDGAGAAGETPDRRPGAEGGPLVSAP